MSGLPVGSRARSPKRERLRAVHRDAECGFGLRELPGKLDQAVETGAQLSQIKSLPRQKQRAANVVENPVHLSNRLTGALLEPGQERHGAMPEGCREPDEFVGRDVAIAGLDLCHRGA